MSIENKFLTAYVIALALFAGNVHAAPPSRIRDSISASALFRLTGNVHPSIARGTDAGPVDDALILPRISLCFSRTAAQSAELARLLDEQQDRRSANYHRWLTPEEFQARFGLGASDIRKVKAWAEERGFHSVEVAPGGSSVSMTGSAGLVAQVFRTSIHRFSVDGEWHYANASDPMLPEALHWVVSTVGGLHDFRPKANGLVSRVKPVADMTFSDGNHAMAPGDFATIYDLQSLYNNGIDGTGQKIAIIAQSDIVLANIQNFRKASGLPAHDPTVVVADNDDPGVKTGGDEDESELDVSWSGAVARGADVVLVTSKDVFHSLAYAIQHNVAPVVSISYSVCEHDVESNDASQFQAMLAQANAQGITIVAGSGDWGGAGCDYPSDGDPTPTIAVHGLSASLPGSSPSVTSVGGTEFYNDDGAWNPYDGPYGTSAIGYLPEEAWNDTAAIEAVTAGGGGPSVLFSKPSWQQARNIPADGARDTPDVALSASWTHDGYLICKTGGCTNGFANATNYVYFDGGTSASAPAFAGMVALINQIAGSSQGNINPRLYQLSSLAPGAFHDITVGDNIIPCQIDSSPDCVTGHFGYQAGVGYDLVTGLGSIDGANLVNSWAPDFKVAIVPGSVSLGTTGSVTAAVQVTPAGYFNGAVSFTCTVPATLTNTTCSVAGTVNGSGSATLTLTQGGVAAGVTRRWFTPTSGLAGAAATLFLIAVCVTSRRNRLRWVAGAATLLMTGCGGGSSPPVSQTVQPPPPLTAQVIVTANSAATTLSAALSHTATVSVSVQQ